VVQLEHQLQVLLVLVLVQEYLQQPGLGLVLLVQLEPLASLVPLELRELEHQLLVLLVLVQRLGLAELLHQELVLVLLVESVDP
jgi:hypothetical protein